MLKFYTGSKPQLYFLDRQFLSISKESGLAHSTALSLATFFQTSPLTGEIKIWIK